MGPGILPETTVGNRNLPCHLQMPTKALSCKKEAICKHGPETPSWAKAHLKWTVSKGKKFLWSDESKFDILVGNYRSRGSRGGRPSNVLSAFSSKASISDGMGKHKCRAAADQMGALSRIVLLCPLPQILWK